MMIDLWSFSIVANCTKTKQNWKKNKQANSELQSETSNLIKNIPFYGSSCFDTWDYRRRKIGLLFYSSFS